MADLFEWTALFFAPAPILLVRLISLNRWTKVLLWYHFTRGFFRHLSQPARRNLLLFSLVVRRSGILLFVENDSSNVVTIR